MNRFMPWIAMLPAHAHEVGRAAGFLYGWLQREQQLNLRACGDWWASPSAAPRARQPLGRGAKARLVHGPVPRSHRRRDAR